MKLRDFGRLYIRLRDPILIKYLACLICLIDCFLVILRVYEGYIYCSIFLNLKKKQDKFNDVETAQVY